MSQRSPQHGHTHSEARGLISNVDKAEVAPALSETVDQVIPTGDVCEPPDQIEQEDAQKFQDAKDASSEEKSGNKDDSKSQSEDDSKSQSENEDELDSEASEDDWDSEGSDEEDVDHKMPQEKMAVGSWFGLSRKIVDGIGEYHPSKQLRSMLTNVQVVR
jgi:hypothetical protein